MLLSSVRCSPLQPCACSVAGTGGCRDAPFRRSDERRVNKFPAQQKDLFAFGAESDNVIGVLQPAQRFGPGVDSQLHQLPGAGSADGVITFALYDEQRAVYLFEY